MHRLTCNTDKDLFTTYIENVARQSILYAKHYITSYEQWRSQERVLGMPNGFRWV